MFFIEGNKTKFFGRREFDFQEWSRFEPLFRRILREVFVLIFIPDGPIFWNLQWENLQTKIKAKNTKKVKKKNNHSSSVTLLFYIKNTFFTAVKAF